MTNPRQVLLHLIKDGEFHSGEHLSTQLHVSRAAVWKSIKQLRLLGVDIESKHGQGYRLRHPLQLLDADNIRRALNKQARQHCRDIEILFETESTNQYLLERFEQAPCPGTVVLAEHQSHGRGRRGNRWLSPLGSGICLSLAWRTDNSYASLGLLSLFVGVAVARTLAKLGVSDVGLKWPNDILVGQQKLGGILVEMQGEANGPVDIIIGVGINYDIPEDLARAVDQPVTDIVSHSTKSTGRNEMAALLISQLLELLSVTSEQEHDALLQEWRQFDCYKDRMANLQLPDSEVSGKIMGIDDDGCLLIRVKGQVQRYMCGELSVRLQT